MGFSKSDHFLSRKFLVFPPPRMHYFLNNCVSTRWVNTLRVLNSHMRAFLLLFWQPTHGPSLVGADGCSRASHYLSKSAFARPARKFLGPSCASTHLKIHKGWTLHLLRWPIHAVDMHFPWPDVLPLQLQPLPATSPLTPPLSEHHWWLSYHAALESPP